MDCSHWELLLLEHGGRLRAAAERWGIALADWLDLSTGIAPDAYPVPDLPIACWQRLPEDEDGLEQAARDYYAAAILLPLPGSQAAIQALPRLRPLGTTAILTPGYGEYAAAWSAAGHRVLPFAAAELEHAATQADVVMLGNPNNPTGARFSRERLLAVARELAERDGWLVVDEAFADAEADATLAAVAGTAAAPNLVVLRSLGKFFGLAGARVGFAFAAPAVLEALAQMIGPWALAHPSRHVAAAALADRDWQAQQTLRLAGASQRLADLLATHGLSPAGGCALFQYLPTAAAERLHDAFAKQGILLRRFDTPAALRFGLPGNEADWARLVAALRGLSAGC
jgi:L-threonine-O-3-phosphate decarboxylase